MNYYEIGQRIRKYRKAYGLTQEQLADKVEISVTHMCHIETGNTKLSLPVLCKIAKALNVQTDEILFGVSYTGKSSSKKELEELFDSCSVHDLHIMLDIMKTTKVSLDKYVNTDKEPE